MPRFAPPSLTTSQLAANSPAPIYAGEHARASDTGRQWVGELIGETLTWVAATKLPEKISQAEAEAGTATTDRTFDALRARQAANAAITARAAEFDSAGAAAAARSAHEASYDHDAIATSLQPEDVHNGVGGLVALVEAIDTPDEGEPISVAALPAVSARNLLEIERILPPTDPGVVIVDPPLRPESPGALGQVAYKTIGSVTYRHTYIPGFGWDREVADLDWEDLEFVGPAISSTVMEAGEAYSRDVHGRFTGDGRTYSLIGAPGWLSINSSGVLSGTPVPGNYTVTVRASAGGLHVDSNAFSLAAYLRVEDDFEALSTGVLTGQPIQATTGGEISVRTDSALALPAGAGTKMLGPSGNATATIEWVECGYGGIVPASGNPWEVMAVVMVNTTSARISIGFIDGIASNSVSAVSTLMIQLDSSRFRMIGSAQPSNGDTSVTPADWLNKWIVLNIGYDGTNVRSRFWELGTTRPDWMVSRAFTYPGSLPTNASLGFAINSQWTESTNRPRIAWFAATENGAALSPPTWSAAEFPVIPAGSLAYLNAMPSVTRDSSRLDAWFADRPYPIRAVGDHQGNFSDDSMIAMLDLFATTSNAPFGSAEIAASDTLLLKKATTQELQLNDNTIFAAGLVNALSTYTSHSEGRLYPGHVVYRAGTTITSALLPGGTNAAVTIGVANAATITPGRFAFIRPAVNWATEGNWELVYVTSVNTSANTITMHRGWLTPKIQSPTYQRAHAAGAYIASVIMGGAANALTSTNGTPANVTYNWRLNITDYCPPDSLGRNMRQNIVDWVSGMFTAINATYGRYPDGIYDDVDHSYPDPSISVGMDCNNDGQVDLGIIGSDPSTAVIAWRDAVEDLENAILAAVGPGTDADAAFFMNGDWVCPTSNYNGSEVEGGYSDSHWATNANWSRADFKTRVHEYNNTRIGNGPRASVNLCRIYTAIWPDIQQSHAESYGGRNSDFRLSYTLSQCLGSFFAMPMSANRFNHFDEFAADPNNDFVCPAWGTNPADSPNKTAIKALRHWMGAPLGPFVRHYDPAVTNRDANLSGINWSGGLPSVNLNQMTGQFFSSGGPAHLPYTGYGRYAPTTISRENYGAPRVARTITGLTIGNHYTLVLTLRCSEHRMIEINRTFSTTPQATVVSSLLPVGPEWTTYVFNFTAILTSVYYGLGVGRTGKAPLDIAEWLVMPGGSWGLSRDFEKALVLANPGPEYTFILPEGATYRRLNGTQDPTVNSGALIESPVGDPAEVTVPAYDGLLLGKVL